MNKYDILIQNNASKQTFLLPGVEDTSESHLYHLFDVRIDAPDGEYTYAIIYNERDDVRYEYKTPLPDTVLHYGDDESIVIKYLQPNTGLLRVGASVEPENIYPKEEKNNDTDSTFIYYE